MKPKVIKTEAEYQAALIYLETLMDAAPNSPEEEELELFSILIENYEEEKFPIDLPDPVEAIKFRMDQQGLSRKELEQYIGSQSKVSEILNRKKPLSLSMIRSLHSGLGIPADILLNQPGKVLNASLYRIQDYPFVEMYKRGYFRYFNGSLQEAKQYSEELLERLFSVLGETKNYKVYCKSSDRTQDENALTAWQARVLDLASDLKFPTYVREDITKEFIREVVKTSRFSTGPTLARELLQKRGIPLIILPHLPHTYLDGACFKTSSGRPVIGMTLRHDRLDNFWFTLIHELSHVFLHLPDSNQAFFDDTDIGIHDSSNPQENEANNLTVDLLIQNETWATIKKDVLTSNQDTKVIRLADQLEISPSILAGRIRWETNDYSRFLSLIGNHTVRRQFISSN